MLHIEIPDVELYNEILNEFYTRKGASINMEHSLLSLSKWESRWHKPFLTEDEKTLEETIDYYRCMTITQNVDPDVYYNISSSLNKKIQDYISDSMTATWFSNISQSNNKDDGSVITSEIIYYWMISLGIPFECQKWHLNRLMTLIRVVSEKNSPSKKMSKQEIMQRQMKLNAERRAKLKSKG